MLMKKFIYLLNKEKYYICISLAFGLLISGAMCVKGYSESVQKGIADSVIRFHVIANSDQSFDQSLKLDIRDAVIKELKGDIEKCDGKIETARMLFENFSRISSISKKIIRENGYDYSVNVSLKNEAFPLKNYGKTVFPAGMYDSLRIDVGNAQGQNWWCVMYPPLCPVEAQEDTKQTDIEKENNKQLKKVLSQEGYSVVVESQEQKIIPKIKFKTVEIWQEFSTDKKSFVTKP